MFQTGDFVKLAIREKGKLRDLGMVFTPSFKCFKNEKVIFIQVILKLECLFYQNIYIISSYIIFVEPFWLKIKSGLTGVAYETTLAHVILICATAYTTLLN